VFIGHFAPAFVAAAAYSRGPKLGTYFIAAQLVDFAFFALAIFGIEKLRIVPGFTAMNPFDLYFLPYTHSALGSAAFALVFGIVIAIIFRDLLAGLLVAMVTFSHWLLDWLTHAPDLTLAGSGETYGLGLWNYPEIAIPLEIGIFLAAFLYYMRRSRGPVAQPTILFLALLTLQLLAWFMPPPAEANLFFYIQALLALAIPTGLAFWVGENRYFMQRGGLAAA